MSAATPIPAQDGHGLEPTLPFADNQDAANRSESTVTMQDSPEAPQTTKRARKPYVPLTYSCGGCDSRWSGVNRAHCSACHRTWTGTTMFDQHRRDVRGVGTCIDPETIPGQVFRDGLWRSAKERPDGTWTRDS